MSRKTALFLSILYLTFYSSIATASDLLYVPGELLVQFAPKPNGEQRSLIEKNQILSSLGAATVKRNYKIVPGLTLVKLPSGQSVEDTLETFNRTDGILLAAPNHKLKYASTFPNDPRFDELWGMHNTGQVPPGGTPDADIDAPEAWNIATRSDIIVAVLDSGVDYTHPDLVDNIWINTDEIPDNGFDDDENGYVDDIYGWDFGVDDADPMDYLPHGTHVAGTIGAVGNNEEGVTGVCWNVKIMVVKISTDYGEPDIGAAIAGIEYAAQMGSEVLNASWGTTSDNPFLKDAIENADANGVLFVAAAGNPFDWEDPNNDTNPHYPSSYDLDNIIAVMATDENDERSIWPEFNRSSAYGPTSVDLAAPGNDILSCEPGGGYQYMSGTSMAAPHVSGTAALIWTRNQALSHLQVKDIILNTVDQLPALNGLCVTEGRLNLYSAITAVPALDLTKTDNVNDGDSVLPGDDIIYTISYGNPVNDVCDFSYLGTVNDVNIIDYLPEEVDFNSASGPNSVYDSNSHTVTWEIGTLSPGDSNSVTLTVNVNQLAEPNGTINNTCVIEANEIRLTSAAEITDVNCWSPDIIYVDRGATGSNTGMSWKNAYLDLQSALARAGWGGGKEIWVAKGTYRPTANPADSSGTFELADGVEMYGGFAGTETALSQRNWITNKTVLTGDIDNDGENNDVWYVVTASDINETAIIDGFIIKMGWGVGVYSDAGSLTIRNNRIIENYDGVRCKNQSSVNITNCEIQDNDDYGINCDDSNSNITNCLIEGSYNDGINCDDSNANITNCLIRDNGGSGIYCQATVAGIEIEIKNNLIHNNGTDGSGTGIYLYSYQLFSPFSVLIRNNTIVNNITHGISSDHDITTNPPIINNSPIISNCIIWGNGTNDSHNLYSRIWYSTFDYVDYCCIEGGGYDGEGNIDDDPLFYDDPNDPNNYHLAPGSPCIDAGDPNFADFNETDIDGEPRIVDGNEDGIEQVDMGADEFYWSPADFDRNEIVNFIDYCVLASAWQTNPNDNDYNDICDLADNNSIDNNDLDIFCDDWLWEPAWTQPIETMMMMMGGGMGGGMRLELRETAAEFYDVTDAKAEMEAELIERVIKWLEEIWLGEDLPKEIDKDEWQRGIERIIESLKEELQN